MKYKLVKDLISLKDRNTLNNNKSMWAKTEIIAGYGDYVNNPNGKSTIGEVIFKTHNMVTISGVQYTMEKLFNKTSDIKIPTLYDLSNHTIGIENSTPSSNDKLPIFNYPSGTTSEKIGDGVTLYAEGNSLYRAGNFIQLFGIGVSNVENGITVLPVGYTDVSIDISKVNDETTVSTLMLPFKYTTATSLSEIDGQTYFGRKKVSTDVTAYYLKKFKDVSVKHTILNVDDSETNITQNDLNPTTTSSNVIDSFTEMHLVISKDDVKEYFTALNQKDRTRISTLALFSGEYVWKDSNNTIRDDFRDVRLFSKLNIPTEHLSMAKDLHILYRVYGS